MQNYILENLLDILIVQISAKEIMYERFEYDRKNERKNR
ncbi:MAG: hypothetical protein PWQ59_2105 [Thermoanaerobacterium sp.]|jgi:hypothetical protein|nr:hypothetical protein [Thermoanaerobacterium sp.]